ncbi:MAG: DNA primase [bacterium]|nr:DNA primase [bacterium]
MSDNISQIKERLSVVDVISGYIKVQKSGANFKARCPFHNEKTPSFYISPERQIWHCFGCQKGGDVFGFVKEIEGIEFVEALRLLAQRAGVKLEQYDPSVSNEKTVLYEICETATRFFEKQLHHSSIGKVALAYLKDRGLNDNTIKEFRLGFAPEGWHNLSQFLRDCGFKDEDIIDSGMTIKKEGNLDMHDRFRSRIIFPIANINDQVIGFTGRVFGDNHPADVGKYINSPQTVIYDKSRVLYGLNKAKVETRKADRCLLVEGNMDAIMSYQAGVKNVAATSGTALTPSHLQILQRYTNNLDFCFDTDTAGSVATRRGIGLGLAHNFNIKIVQLQDPECKDPADYVKKFGQNPPNGRAGWNEVVLGAKPVIDFYFDKLKSELDLNSVDGKKGVIASLGPLINRLASQVEKSYWISKLAVVLRTKEEAIESDILSVKDDLEVYTGNAVESRRNDPIPEIISPSDILSEAILAVIIKNPPLFYQELEGIGVGLLDPDTLKVVNEIKKTGSNFKFDSFVNDLDDKKRMKLEFAHLKAQEFLKEFDDEELMAEFKNIKSKLEQRSVTAQLTSLESEIKMAETDDDKSKMKSLLSQFGNLAKQLKKN